MGRQNTRLHDHQQRRRWLRVHPNSKGEKRMKWLRWLTTKACSHEFHLSDLKRTGIKEPERPANDAGFDAHMKWHQSLYTGPWYTERVEWHCFKCGKAFRAHCGLDISPEHGFVRPQKVTA
jgi:hypothetical protein